MSQHPSHHHLPPNAHHPINTSAMGGSTGKGSVMINRTYLFDDHYYHNDYLSPSANPAQIRPRNDHSLPSANPALPHHALPHPTLPHPLLKR